MSTISVILIGAGGVLGRPILTELLRQRASFARVAVLTSPEKGSIYETLNVDVITSSLYDPKSYKGFTHVISAVGNALMILQPAMVEAAITGGVRHFYASEWNSDISQRAIYDMRYFRDKQAVRAFLRAKAAQVPDFQYTLMVTGIFTEWSVDGFYGFNHETRSAEIHGFPDRRVGVTSIPDIARYTVDSLHLKFSGSQRTLRVQGWTGTIRELIAQLELVTKASYNVVYLDGRELARLQEEARLDGDDHAEMMSSIKGLLASGYGVADSTEGLDNGLFSFTPEQPVQTFERIFN